MGRLFMIYSLILQVIDDDIIGHYRDRIFPIHIEHKNAFTGMFFIIIPLYSLTNHIFGTICTSMYYMSMPDTLVDQLYID